MRLTTVHRGRSQEALSSHRSPHKHPVFRNLTGVTYDVPITRETRQFRESESPKLYIPCVLYVHTFGTPLYIHDISIYLLHPALYCVVYLLHSLTLHNSGNITCNCTTYIISMMEIEYHIVKLYSCLYTASCPLPTPLLTLPTFYPCSIPNDHAA
jgi:hypothetical protein